MSFTKLLDGAKGSVRSLTLVDESDVLLVCGRQAVVLLVCGEARGRLVVLPAVGAAENDLGRREAGGCENKAHHESGPLMLI